MESKILLLSLLSILVLTSAENITVTRVEMEVMESGWVHVKENLIFHAENYTNETALTVPKSSKLEIYDQYGKLNYSLTSEENEDKISFHFSKVVDTGEDRGILIRYDTQTFTNKKSNLWTIDFSLPVTANSTLVKVKFPSDAKVSSISQIANWLYIEDNRPVVELHPSADNVTFLCDYELTTEQTIPVEEKSFSYELLILCILVVFLLAFIFFKFRKKQKKEKVLKPAVLNMLSESERKVIGIIIKKGEETTQAFIRKETGIPRATLTRLVKKLEERNLIECNREGKVNWIKPKAWIFK